MKLGSVAGPVIKANGRLTFEDDMRSGGLLLSLSWPIQSDHLSIADWMIPVGTFSWQGLVHSWNAGPGEVMTVLGFFIGLY